MVTQPADPCSLHSKKRNIQSTEQLSKVGRDLSKVSRNHEPGFHVFLVTRLPPVSYWAVVRAKPGIGNLPILMKQLNLDILDLAVLGTACKHKELEQGGPALCHRHICNTNV